MRDEERERGGGVERKSGRALMSGNWFYSLLEYVPKNNQNCSIALC